MAIRRVKAGLAGPRKNYNPTLLREITILLDPLVSTSELNHDFGLISQWVYQWNMTFNPDPTKQLFFRTNKKVQITRQSTLMILKLKK